MQKPGVFVRILRAFTIVWTFLVILSVLLGGLSILILEGWERFIVVFNPLNIANYLVFVVSISPAVGANAFANYLERRNENAVEAKGS